MTNHDYKAIADRLVEQEILIRYVDHPESPLYCLDESGKYVSGGCYSIDVYPAEQLCHDWRVAGAVLEEIRKRGMTIMLGPDGVEQLEHPSWSGYHWERNESLPLAVILAYLEATDGA